jgi:carbamoyl-phosphate synthase large subunit
VILTLGGQTPLKLAHCLERQGVPLLGTPLEAIDRAEDRDRFAALCQELEIAAPAFSTARTLDEACTVALDIGYPIMVRPSYVLGGRAMRVVYDEEGLRQFFDEAARVAPEHPVLLDRFLEDAVEFDVDAICDGQRVLIGGVLQHIEEAGIHSGDSFAVLPPFRISAEERREIEEITTRMALALGVVGLINLQLALFDGKLNVIEVNPRASRTVPFLEKAKNVPLVKIATRCMMGQSLDEQGVTRLAPPDRVFVKGPVFPFRRFADSDRLLGPEMKSTGEVMGIGPDFGSAFERATLGSGVRLPEDGCVFLSLHDRDKDLAVPIARDFVDLGFELVATRGTQHHLQAAGLDCDYVAKVGEGSPDVAQYIHDARIQLVVNTPLGKQSRYDERAIRRSATMVDIPCITTLSGARAAADAIANKERHAPQALQEMGPVNARAAES